MTDYDVATLCVVAALFIGGYIGYCIASSNHTSDPRFIVDAQTLWQTRHQAEALDRRLTDRSPEYM